MNMFNYKEQNFSIKNNQYYVNSLIVTDLLPTQIKYGKQ